MTLEIVNPEEVQNILNNKKIDSAPVEQVVNAETSTIPLIKVDKLPSGFKGYPQGTTISYSPMTIGELEAINSGDTIDVERGLAMLINSIHCTTINPYDLYYWDVIYIGVKRKILAFGDTRGTLYEYCPNCGEIIQREFDYTEMEFKELEAEALPIITTINEKEVEFAPLTIKEFLELPADCTDIDVYAKMIKNLSFEKSYKLVESAYGKDAKKIRFIDKKLNYGIKPFIQVCINEIDNPNFDKNEKVSKTNSKKIKCNTQVRMEVRSPFEVVFPENIDDGLIASEIRYGE